MAVTKIHPIKSTLKKALDYIVNPKKTLDGLTVSSFGCSPEFADTEFGFTKKKACKENGILAYHLIQSFAPSETDFKTAHEIGERLCEKFLKGKYEYVISTHIDKGHIHNHIIFNSVSFVDNMKYNSTPQSYFFIRRTSDVLCRDFGLSVISPSKDKGKSYYEYTADSKAISWKTKLRRTIDEQLLYAQNYDDFLKRMGGQNYRIKEGKYLSFCGVGQEKFIRSKTLGEDYSVDALKLRIQGRYKPYKANIIIDIQNNVKCGQSRGYTQWCQIHNLKAMAAMLNSLTENNMRTLSDLDGMEQKFLSEMTAARDKLKPVEARLKELDSIMKNIQTFRDNKERKNDAQKVLYKAALKELQPYIHDNKLPGMVSLKKEYDRLDEQKQELSIDYFTRKDTLKEFRDVKKNLETVVPKVIVCDDMYAQNIIDDFKQPEKDPIIAVSVDMMDTGIDVPNVCNLVFFKKVCSRTKFWQMIGRGTRLCKGLQCIDSVDGAYTDKRRFYIFDYCGNFDFFRQHINGFEGKETQTLSEAIFIKRVRIIQDLQQSNYADSEYQSWRSELADTVFNQINSLNDKLFTVKLQRKHIEKFADKSRFDSVSEGDLHSLTKHIAPLVYMDEEDECAKRFDNFMYGLILSQVEVLKGFKKAKNDLMNTMVLLEKKNTIPQIKDKLPIIQRICSDEFWNNCNPLEFEKVRVELRELMKFIVDDGLPKPPIYTDIEDLFSEPEVGEKIDDGYDFEDYRLKVNRYIETHKDDVAIWKLRNNMPLTSNDYQALSDIFTQELGSKDDYQREFGDTPLGLLVRKIAKMEHEAAMTVFSSFINEQGLNQQQIVFVNKIVDYVVQNGYIESVAELLKPPFDKPQSFIKLFSASEQTVIISLVNMIKENAVKIA